MFFMVRRFFGDNIEIKISEAELRRLKENEEEAQKLIREKGYPLSTGISAEDWKERYGTHKGFTVEPDPRLVKGGMLYKLTST